MNAHRPFAWISSALEIWEYINSPFKGISQTSGVKSTHSRKTEIPDRLYFRIGEVSSLVGVDPHVLRYWETEFKVVKPRRAKSKQRLYRRKDVENLLQIKTLLHDEGYTIAGARRLLKEPSAISGLPKRDTLRQGKEDKLDIIKKELQAILKTINSA